MRTVGVEEELLLIDPSTAHTVATASEVVRRAALLGEDLDAELKQEQVETGTAPQQELLALLDDIRGRRRVADEAARTVGARVAALPISPLDVVSQTTPKGRYLWLAENFGLTQDEQLACGCHVHVSVDSPEEGVGVIDRARVWLPVLTALTANSPFWRGQDTGYASFRAQLWGRWPMAGPIEVLGSVEAYRGLLDSMLSTGVVLDEAMVYLDARLSARYPTVELRVADVCLHADDAVLLAGLARALVHTAAHEWRTGRPAPDVPAAVLRLARWRASRSGLSDELLDPETHRPRPAGEVVEHLYAHVRPALAEAGDEAYVRKLLDDVLARGTGATRQRQTYARTGSLRDVVLDVVELTT
jgi:carboxylate-amine ligase